MTERQFFAAARIIVGPPISIFSIASSNVILVLLIVSSKGYKLTQSKSIALIPYLAKVSICEALSLLANKAAWILGCKVLTRPSNISGNSIISLTSITEIPASDSKQAVPPVDKISTPPCCKARANATTPFLSDVLIKARCICCVDNIVSIYCY